MSQDGLLLRVTALRGKTTAQLVVPASLQQELLDEAHSNARGGLHTGLDGLRMFEALSIGVWWRTMRADCLDYHCAVCQRQKPPHGKPAGLLHSTPAGRPGQSLSMDLVPMPASGSFHGFAILVDRFSGAVSVAPYTPKKPTSAEALDLYSQCLNPLFVDVEQLTVDSDSVLSSKDFKQAIEARGTALRVAFAGHQQANFAERDVQIVKRTIRTTLDGLPLKAWPSVLKDITQHLNSMYRVAKGASAYEILTGWQPRSLIPFSNSVDASSTLGHVFAHRQQLWDRVAESMKQAYGVQARQYDRTRIDRRFREGDVVLVRRLREEKEDGNFNLSSPMDPALWRVEQVLSEVSLLLRSIEKKSKLQEVHVSRVSHAVHEQDNRTSEDEYVVERILNHRKVGRNHELQYLIQWSGYRDKRSNRWVARSVLLDGAKELLQRYDRAFSVQP